MTEAMIDWLEDDKAVHPLNLNNALSDFNIILGLYMSALNHQVIELLVEPEDQLIQKLTNAL